MTNKDTGIITTRFSIGDIIHHKLFDYRGVIVDIDPSFQLTDEWYETVARSRPPKNAPWYHVLVHNALNSTYVAEQNLEADPNGLKINHPMVERYFSDLVGGRYVNGEKAN